MKTQTSFKVIIGAVIIAMVIFASSGTLGSVFAQGMPVGGQSAALKGSLSSAKNLVDQSIANSTTVQTPQPTIGSAIETVSAEKSVAATATPATTTGFPKLPVSLSTDGKIMYHGVAPLVIVADPNQTYKGIKIPDSEKVAKAISSPESSTSNFIITFASAGSYDLWGAQCQTFPTDAQTALRAATAIWASTVTSAVPIKIFACWSNINSDQTLAYSGGGNLYRDFPGAPVSGTWYDSSLADALAGSDLKSSGYYDDYITFNTQFSWYYGTDGNPPATSYDMVSVAAHELCHGLNFSGTATYSSGTGSFGVADADTTSPVYPNIYDSFMEDASGKKLITYTNDSTDLGNLLTSDALYFNGTNANAANGGSRVKIYAPSDWSVGSSYSHLDYTTFAGTSNSMMAYAVGAGASNHNPGEVTKGILFDMGWTAATDTPTVPTPATPNGTITNVTPTYTWSAIDGATQYTYNLFSGSTTVYSKTVTSSSCDATTCTSTPTTALADGSYTWNVSAYVNGVWKSYSSSQAFAVTTVPTLTSPSGLITTTTPTFTWSTIASASQYDLTVLNNGTSVYTQTVTTSNCGSDSTICTFTPSTALMAGSDYTWEVRSYVGGVAKTYSSAMSFSIQSSTGFDTEFTTDAPGWSIVRGNWVVTGGNLLATDATNYFASAFYSSSQFGTMTYEVALQRAGDPNAANGIIFNGTHSTAPNSNFGRWKSGYAFYVTTNGAFSIWRYDNYVTSKLLGWTASSLINSSGTNDLKVTFNADTGFVQFYINDVRVAYGVLNNYTSGQVGLTYYDSGYAGGDQLSVDFAKVSLSAPSSSVAGKGLDLDEAATAKGGVNLSTAGTDTGSDTGNY
jgi:hypothetical protein